MKIECKDLDYVLRRQEPESLEALKTHADQCALCRDALRNWSEISAAASQLSRDWHSPDLWPRIHQALAAESQLVRLRRPSLRGLLIRWQSAAGVLAVVLIAVAAVWILLRNGDNRAIAPETASDERLLTEHALREIERSESVYIGAIEKLAGLVEPKVQQATSPLLFAYREKLMLIDAAIVECRANIERNRFNAHLRQELLFMYREKQQTLQELLKEDKHELR